MYNFKIGDFVKMKYRHDNNSYPFYKRFRNTIWEIIERNDYRDNNYGGLYVASVWDNKITFNFYPDEVYRYNFTRLPDKLFKMEI